MKNKITIEQFNNHISNHPENTADSLIHAMSLIYDGSISDILEKLNNDIKIINNRFKK